MKKIIYSFLFTLLCTSLNAQTPAKDKELSNAEVFSAKAGALMQK